MKVDVASDLPKKNEQVLFCKLTKIQRQAYLQFIHSKDMDSILEHRRQVLFGIDIVRKICNHPDIINLTLSHSDPDYGNSERSGKMMVVKALLNMWKQQQHRVLLFSQTRQMLDILEIMMKRVGYNYLRMDGSTPVSQRMSLVNQFNDSSETFVFLLTTKVGGLGINLTGANRIILYDPDWVRVLFLKENDFYLTHYLFIFLKKKESFDRYASKRKSMAFRSDKRSHCIPFNDKRNN